MNALHSDPEIGTPTWLGELCPDCAGRLIPYAAHCEDVFACPDCDVVYKDTRAGRHYQLSRLVASHDRLTWDRLEGFWGLESDE